MTVREPTPWGTYAVIGGVIALAVYLHQAHDYSVYAWMESLIAILGNSWWATLLVGVGSLLVVVALAKLLHKALFRAKCYRVRFRNGTLTNTIYAHAWFIVGVYFMLFAWWSLIQSIRLLFA